MPLNTPLKPAFCKDDILYHQVRERIANGHDQSFDIWWLGQSGFLLQWNKKCILFDPYLSDSLTKKYEGTSKPHVRISERAIAPEKLDCIDVVTSSHNHTDHLDGETLIPLIKANPHLSFIIPEANRKFVATRAQCDLDFPIGLNDGEKISLHGFTIHGVPAAHNSIDRDDQGRCHYMGFVATFGKFCVYHSGDTLWYEGMVETLKPYHVDVAFLPINGNDPARGVAGNLNPEEAARLGKEIGARCVIPHHFDMFSFNTADPEDFALEAKRYGQDYKVLRIGEHTVFSGQ